MRGQPRSGANTRAVTTPLAVAAGVLCLVALAAVGCRSEYNGAKMSWSRTVKGTAGEPEIRVAVAERASSVHVRVDGRCRLVVGPSGQVVDERPSLDWRVEPTPRGFRVNGVQYAAPWIEFRPEGARQASIDGRPYPGATRVLLRDGKLLAVNIVALERYLCGVVGNEMYPSWEPAALQAQAVAARSYALARLAVRTGDPFDVYFTVRSQAYAGGAVPASVAAAVAETRGVVLTHQKRVAPAYYHSSCGGHTTGAGDVFGDREEAFIRGVRCAYCGEARTFAWEAAIKAETIAEKVLGSSARQVTALQAVGRREDGRPATIRVFTPEGHEDIGAERFRERLGWREVRSSRFWIESAPGGFRLVGRGFGHGVGLCQYGAQRMAELGADYEQILFNYYPELSLATLY